MQQYIKNATILLISLLISMHGYTQISATSASLEQNPYPTTKNFFFPIVAGATITGEGNLSGATTSAWNKYNPATNDFSIPIQVANGPIITISNLEHNGGYEFSCTDGITTVKYYCWTFEPKITIDSIYVNESLNTCTEMGLKSDTTALACIYRDPLNLNNAKSADYMLAYNWSATPTDVDIPKVANPRFIQPIENTRYSLTLSNGLGLPDIVKEMATEHTAKGLRAGFKMTILTPNSNNNKDNKLDTIPTMASGPITLSFSNDSKGDFDYAEIRIYKDNSTNTYKPAIPDAQTYPITLSEPGKYSIQMHIKNYKTECTSVSEESKDSVITLGGSVLGIPNTFTPDADGINDEFKIVFLSLREYQINIYNRWGRLVYSSDDPMKGWDGGGLAVGVYMYIVEATGIDGRTYKEKGSVHLLRKN